LGETGLISSEPGFVPLTALTFRTVESDLPCGAISRVQNDDRSLRRVPGILLEADQIHKASAATTPDSILLPEVADDPSNHRR
jgi:hypothetical protein